MSNGKPLCDCKGHVEHFIGTIIDTLNEKKRKRIAEKRGALQKDV
jgi:hypothetical protein